MGDVRFEQSSREAHTLHIINRNESYSAAPCDVQVLRKKTSAAAAERAGADRERGKCLVSYPGHPESLQAEHQILHKQKETENVIQDQLGNDFTHFITSVVFKHSSRS